MLRFLLAAFALLFFVAGVLAVLSIRSDIQLILVALLLGFSLTFAGLFGIADELVDARKERRAIAAMLKGEADGGA